MTRTLDEMLGDYLDSRDIAERLHELEADEDRDEDETDEMGRLRAIYDQVSSTFGKDTEYGVSLIPEDQFEDYARELAEDLGSINKDGEWPTTYIDWEAAAGALKMDYASITIEGKEYWGRA